MTTDDVLGRDLAALARDGRDRVPPLDELLAAIEPAPRAPALDLLASARVYADRVGWIAAGASVVVASLVLLVACALGYAFANPWSEFRLLGRIIEVPTDRVSFDVVALACVVWGVARRIGEGRFARALARGGDARAIAAGIEDWAVAGWIAGATLVVQLWGSFRIATYSGSLWPVFDVGVWYALASPIAVAVAAIAVARRRDARWVRALERRPIPVAAALLLAGAFDVHFQLMNDDLALPLATDLATRVVATLALFAAAAWLALRRNRRERATIRA